nr:Down syndrome cell adhesion molecule-like protein Dscam2 [Parasteatoda tepidariorum]
MKDGGMYECEADNGIDHPLKKTVQVRVKVPAKFEEKFAVVNVKKGDSGRMKDEALGDQPLSITWQRDDATISKTGDERFGCAPCLCVMEIMIMSSII